jgi:hypothetical protein
MDIGRTGDSAGPDLSVLPLILKRHRTVACDFPPPVFAGLILQFDAGSVYEDWLFLLSGIFTRRAANCRLHILKPVVLPINTWTY